MQENKPKIGARGVKRAATKVSASRSDWKEQASPRREAPRFAFLSILLVLSAGSYFYFNAEWLFSLVPTEVSEIRPAPARPEFALKLGAFLLKEQAEEFRARLAKEDFSATVAAKDFGDGWTLYQVRLPGPYTEFEAGNIINRLGRLGIQSVEKIPLNSDKAD